MFGWFAQSQGSAARDPNDDFWFEETPSPSRGTIHVTHETAMSLVTLYACIKTIAETEAQLPLHLFRRAVNGDKTPTTDHPVFTVIHERANDEHTALELREMMTAWAAMRGTAVAEIIPGSRGAVEQLIPLHPDHLRCVKVTDLEGRTRWQFEHREPGAPARRLRREDLFILRAMSTRQDCPLLGVDPVLSQAAMLGAAISAQDYSARFFLNDARMSGIVKHPSYFKTQDDRNTWRNAFQRAFSGRNRHKVALLEWGMEYQQVSVTPEQAQFLETRKFQREDIAAMFRMPPHKVGILERSTNNNIEHQGIEFVSDTMLPWLVRWEQSIKRDLLTDPSLFAEHNVAGLLRGDLLTRYQAYAIGRNWGWLSANDILRLENMNSIGERGDIYLQPMNMVEAGTVVAPIPDSEVQPSEEEASLVVTDVPFGLAKRINGNGAH